MTDGISDRAPSLVGLRLSVMMFLQFFVWGAWYVSVGLYMAAHGMSDGIYWAYTVGPIAAIVSPFFLGMVADRFFATERVLGVMHLLGGAALLVAPAVAEWSAGGGETGNSYRPFVGVLLLHMLCYMPTLGLTSTLAFRNMTDRERQFPLIRVFGTVGWIAANWVVSKGFHAETLDTQFSIAGGAAIALGIFSFTLPHTPPPLRGGAGRRVSVRDILGLDSLALLRRPSFAVFIISSLLICVPLSAYYAYAPVYAGAVGFADVAFTMSFGQISEIVFMLAMPLCFATLGVKWMLAAGMLAWAVRYGLFATAADEQIKWMVLAGILLHGICYDFFFVAGQIYVDRRVPAEVRGQAQGFLVLITQGLGMLIGAQIIGRVFNRFTIGEGAGARTDWQTVWLVPCVMAGVVLVAFCVLFREPGARGNGERSA